MPKLYDPVHQFIYLDDDEVALLDTLPFQRLRYIRQMGTAYLVYPGATHSRFEHSLGVMELATQIFDRIVSRWTPPGQLPDYGYWRKIVRLAALCHDSGHLPFSHVAEKALLGKEGHERWTYQIIKSPFLEPIWNKLTSNYPGNAVAEHIARIAIGEKKLAEIGHPHSFSAWERILCEIITGDFFGADRIDYLLRDARSTGVSYGLFDYHQLIETIRILPHNLTQQEAGESDLELGIEENGIESCEALLLARHFMHRRVYQHQAVKSYNFHLCRFMQKAALISDLECYLTRTDNEVLEELFNAVRDVHHPGHFDAKCFLHRHERYRAVALGAENTLEQIEAFKRDYHLPPDAMAWDFVPYSSSKMGFTFPVLQRNQKIVSGSSLSILSIPKGSSNWVYLDPAYEEIFLQYLEK